MRYLILLVFTLLSVSLVAQPDGQLYFSSVLPGQNQHILAYIDYPTGQLTIIDSVGSADLEIFDNKLYAAQGGRYTSGTDLQVYDLDTHQKDTTLENVFPMAIDMWDGNLVVASSRAPFLRVYDIQNNYNLLFSVLDSQVITGRPVDLKVLDDRAYVLSHQDVIVVDMDLEDTLAVVNVLRPPFFRENVFLSELEGKLYVETAYSTAVPRSDYFRLDPTTLQLDSIFHGELTFTRSHPITTKDQLYTFQFDSHYDLQADSFVISESGFWNQWAIAYDQKGESLFIADNSNKGIYYRNKGDSLQFVSVPGTAISGTFFERSPNSIAENTFLQKQLTVFPNPTTDKLTINFSEPHHVSGIRVLNSKGQVVQQERRNGFTQEVELMVNNLSRGGYFVEVAYEDTRVRSAFVKW